jgi:hypothetical protein
MKGPLATANGSVHPVLLNFKIHDRGPVPEIGYC